VCDRGWVPDVRVQRHQCAGRLLGHHRSPAADPADLPRHAVLLVGQVRQRSPDLQRLDHCSDPHRDEGIRSLALSMTLVSSRLVTVSHTHTLLCARYHQPEDLAFFQDPYNRDTDIYKVRGSLSRIDRSYGIDAYLARSLTRLQPVKFWFYNGIVTETLDRVGMRIKGGISRNWAKKPWKLSFNKFEPGTCPSFLLLLFRCVAITTAILTLPATSNRSHLLSAEKVAAQGHVVRAYSSTREVVYFADVLDGTYRCHCHYHRQPN